MEPDEITRRLKIAAEAVERAALPEVLTPIAFQRSLDAVGLTEHRESPPHGSGHRADPVRTAADNGALAKIAARLNLPIETVEQVFEDDGEGGVRLIIKRTMLPTPDQKAASMRHIALLTAVGRQAAETEEYTASSLIREECAELKVLDPSNFATEVGKLQMRRRGSRNKQELKANRHHVDDAEALIRAITGGESS